MKRSYKAAVTGKSDAPRAKEGDSSKSADISSSQKIYASMARLRHSHAKVQPKTESVPHANMACSSTSFVGDLYNWVLNSGATCHMTPFLDDFIPGTMETVDKFVEVADGHYVPGKQQGKVRIRMHDDVGRPFQIVLEEVLYILALAERLFLILMCTDKGHKCLFDNGYCTISFGSEGGNAVTLSQHHEHQRTLPTKIRDQKWKPARSRISLERLHQRLGHRATRSLIAADTAGLWADTEIWMSPDPFCTSCKIAAISK